MHEKSSVLQERNLVPGFSLFPARGAREGEAGGAISRAMARRVEIPGTGLVASNKR